MRALARTHTHTHTHTQLKPLFNESWLTSCDEEGQKQLFAWHHQRGGSNELLFNKSCFTSRDEAVLTARTHTHMRARPRVQS